ncbi:MAG: NUDIX hydrolase [Clostridia bacterium]|nr:NUDIX hydrolase [Clostridia bacterium]
MNYEEKTISKRKVFNGAVIDVEVHEVILPNGKTAKRDIVLHPGGAFVIPINENGEVYMVRQFRKPLEAFSLELPAGKLDQGEDPAECAKRELREETGLRAAQIRHVLSFNTTPGFCNELLHMYVATGLEEGESCTDEDEFLSTEKYKVDELLAMVLKGEITDAKSIIGILMADKIIKGAIKF